MSFYENQYKARRKTGLLTFYFICAVILIILAIDTTIYLFLSQSEAFNLGYWTWLTSKASAMVAGITLCIIFCGSLFRAIQLRDGGASIAQLAGGRHIDFDTTDPQEKKLINVVEEMAIASGTKPPQLYVLDREPGINAFVAGLNPNDTALAVTRGALELLTRDELQGVIGHEYSHILNGDMRLNVRLIAILAGILLIGQVGEFLIRSGAGRRSYSSRSDNKDGASLALLGLGIMMIGYIGLFFGRLIKAAISRQREFLADASSVQFTRNPLGIGGALYKIGQQGSLLNDRHAEEMSHMCFGSTLKSNLSGWLATHPPIDERLKAIDPHLKSRLLASGIQPTSFGQPQGSSANEQASMGFAETSSVPSPDTLSPPQDSGPIPVTPDRLKESIGTVSVEQARFGQQALEQLNPLLIDTAHHPALAEAIIYGLILCPMGEQTDNAYAMLQTRVNEKVLEQTRQIVQALGDTPVNLRLPLLDMAIATLEILSQEQKNKIISTTQTLIQIDKRISLSEFVFLVLLRKYLGPRKAKPARTINSLKKVSAELETLFKALIRASGEPEPERQKMMQHAANLLGFKHQEAISAPNATQLEHALEKLGRLSPLLKQSVIDTCIDCIIHDNLVAPLEAELLRAVCESLDCPMPPILPEQT